MKTKTKPPIQNKATNQNSKLLKFTKKFNVREPSVMVNFMSV